MEGRQGDIMKDNYIEIPRYLTSYEFFNSVLPQYQEGGWRDKGNIILDFSETVKVEPLVIPNLLCLGYAIKREIGMPFIYIPDTNDTAMLKNYLYAIGFTQYAEEYGLYRFVNPAADGLRGKRPDPICKTLYFDLQDSVDDICGSVRYCVAPFDDKYLSRFRSEQKTDTGIYYANDITEFLSELIMNSQTHARSFSFVTMHAKYSVNTIYLAVSDFGCGFLYTASEFAKCRDEVEAIFAGIYRRKESKVYGLYNVIRRILEFRGKVRIHSNDRQIILTQRTLNHFLENQLQNNTSFKEYNIKRTVPFDGVHIEIELPLEGSGENVHHKGRGYRNYSDGF